MLDREDLSRRTLLAAGASGLLAACAGRAGSGGSGRNGGSGAATLPGPVLKQHERGSPGILDIEADLPRMMRVAGVPGVAIAVVERERMTTRGVGVTRAGTGNAVNADTVFEAASLSKPVFAYLAMRLAGEGVLDLDRPLHEYLAMQNGSDPRAKSITARHALSHTSGWRNWRNASTPLLVSEFDPGSRFSYSGEGFYFLARVIEKLTGRGILRLTRERVFEPIGMRRSSYLWSPELNDNRADPHSNRGVASDGFSARVGKQFRDAAAAEGKSMDDWTHDDSERLHPKINTEQPALPNWLLPNVAGSLLTTAADYALFLRHLLGDGRPTLDAMQMPQITMNEALRWGLGVGVQISAGRTQFWHWGDNFGFKNFVIGDAAAGNAIVVFTNGQNGRAIYERVIRAVKGDQAAFLWI